MAQSNKIRKDGMLQQSWYKIMRESYYNIARIYVRRKMTFTFFETLLKSRLAM